MTLTLSFGMLASKVNNNKKNLKEIPLLCLTSMKETDGEVGAATEDSPWQVFPSSLSLRPGGHRQ